MVLKGFYCPVLLDDGTSCSFTVSQESSLKEHLKGHPKSHSRPKNNELKSYVCDCQTVFISTQRLYFRVKTGLGPDPLNPYSVFLRHEAKNVPGDFSKSVETFKNEELPSLLQDTQWHLFVEGYRTDPQDIVGLIRYLTGSVDGQEPLEKILANLPGVSDAWMLKASRYWEQSSDHARRVLDGYLM